MTLSACIVVYNGYDEVLKAAQADGGTGHAKEDLTMEDLLNAAVAKGDLKGYDASSSSYGGKYLNSITSKDGAVLAGWNSDDYSLGQFWACSPPASRRAPRSTR